MQTALHEAPPLPISVASSAKTQIEIETDPRLPRYGYNPGVYQMAMDPRTSGLQERIIPGGVLLNFETGHIKEENYEGVLKKNARTQEILKEKTAAWFIRNVMNTYGRGGTKDKGFRELTPLMNLDPEEARYIFYSVHPTFGMLGHKCPYEMEVCPTCRLEMLKVPANTEVGEALRRVLIDSNTRYRSWAESTYASRLSEVERRHNGDPGMTTLKAPEHWLRRQLHLAKPADQQVDMAAKLADAQAKQTAEGFNLLGDKFAEAIATIANKPLDPVQQKQLEVMQAMMEKMQTPAPVAEAEAKPTRKAKE